MGMLIHRLGPLSLAFSCGATALAMAAACHVLLSGPPRSSLAAESAADGDGRGPTQGQEEASLLGASLD